MPIRVIRTQTAPANIALITFGTAVCAALLLAGYLSKRRCVGPSFDAAGRSGPNWRIRLNRDLCYSDIQQLWLGRDINLHVFPYIHGGITAGGQLTGGAVEYPVLTGLAMWIAGRGAHNDGQFLAHGALLLAPFGLLTAAILFALAGRRAFWFALAPALVMYGFLSWDLLPVACTTCGVAVLAAGPAHWTRRHRAILAAIAFGIGGAAKFYPLMFTAPLIAWMLQPGPGGITADPAAAGGSAPRRDIAGAALAAGAAAGTWTVINAPFAAAGLRGWWAAFEFQWSRPVDLTTNSIWFWAGRPATNSSDVKVQHALTTASTAATAAGMLAVLIAGAMLTHRDRFHTYPWLQVNAAMLCAYLLLNKVHSPQYALWLLPFFVLLRIRAGWIIAYYLADLAMGVGFLRWQYLIITDQPNGIFDNWAAQAVMIGVWGRAALLVCLGIAFTTATAAAPRSEWRNSTPNLQRSPRSAPAVNQMSCAAGRLGESEAHHDISG